MGVDWAAEGLLDGLEGDDRRARAELLDLLAAEGYHLQRVRRAHEDGEPLFLPSGRAIDIEAKYTWAELIERTGVAESLAERLVTAQGLPRPDKSARIYTEVDRESLTTAKTFVD